MDGTMARSFHRWLISTGKDRRTTFNLYPHFLQTMLLPMNLTHLPLAGIFGLGGMELIAILAIIMLLFGGAKLPALAKGLGQSIKEFKKAARDDDSDVKKSETIQRPEKK